MFRWDLAAWGQDAEPQCLADFQEVDRHSVGIPNRLTYYDDGVGTDNLRWVRLTGGAFGCGLSRNIRQAYAFLCLNYKPGDDIYLFGFSRGAFPVRSLAGMALEIGLLECCALSRQGTIGRGCSRSSSARIGARTHPLQSDEPPQCEWTMSALSRAVWSTFRGKTGTRRGLDED